jgi:hypothetical protein
MDTLDGISGKEAVEVFFEPVGFARVRQEAM